MAAFPVVTTTPIAGNTVNAVNARDLHAFLGIGKDFSSWIKEQITRARLIENRDFVKLTEKGELSRTGQTRTDYFVTFDAAKQIGLMCGSDKGFEVRNYFIECEKKVMACKVEEHGECDRKPGTRCRHLKRQSNQERKATYP